MVTTTCDVKQCTDDKAKSTAIQSGTLFGYYNTISRVTPKTKYMDLCKKHQKELNNFLTEFGFKLPKH